MESARLFAREGCFVILAARRMDRLQALKREIQKNGGSVMVIPVDVSQPGEIKKMAEQVLKAVGRVDILFNNAGYGRMDWLENLSLNRDILGQIEVNLIGTILVTQAILPSMLKNRSGHIINMCSVAGLLPAPMYSLYSASKFGLRGFTNSLRREVSPFGIKVSAIYPGPALTEFSQNVGHDTAVRKMFKPPRWIYLDSKTVARRVVALAKHPRRMVVIPWYYRVLLWIDSLAPGLVDWFLRVTIVKRSHKLPAEK